MSKHMSLTGNRNGLMRAMPSWPTASFSFISFLEQWSLTLAAQRSSWGAFKISTSPGHAADQIISESWEWDPAPKVFFKGSLVVPKVNPVWERRPCTDSGNITAQGDVSGFCNWGKLSLERSKIVNRPGQGESRIQTQGFQVQSLLFMLRKTWKAPSHYEAMAEIKWNGLKLKEHITDIFSEKEKWAMRASDGIMSFWE